MGRAINDRKDIDKLQMEMKELQGVVTELSQALVQAPQVHHVDLTDTRDVVAEGVEVEADEKFTPKTGKSKSTPRQKIKEPKRVESLL